MCPSRDNRPCRVGGGVVTRAMFRSSGLSGVHHLLEGRLVDDMVVVEGGFDQAFGDVKVSGCGVDVVLARFLGVDVCMEVGERAEERLLEAPLELLALGLRGGQRAKCIVARPDDVAEAPAELESPRVGPGRAQGEPAGTAGVVAQPEGVGNVKARPSLRFEVIDIDADNLAEAGVAQGARRHASRWRRRSAALTASNQGGRTTTGLSENRGGVSERMRHQLSTNQNANGTGGASRQSSGSWLPRRTSRVR